MDLPGVKPEDLQVEVRGNDLWLTGERHQEKEEKGKNYHRIEQEYGRFERAIPLAAAVSEDKIKAHYKNGVLKVIVPKSEAVRPRRDRLHLIEIRSADRCIAAGTRGFSASGAMLALPGRRRGVRMYHSILVPLDGSQFAEQALPLALNIANRAGASLEIVRVHELYAFQNPHCSWSPFDPAADAKFREQERTYLDTIVERLKQGASAPMTSALVNGSIEDRILERTRASVPI